MAVAHPLKPKRRVAQERGARLEARISEEDKDLLQRAAALEGKTLTEFMVSSIRGAAERSIREHEMLTLTVRESQGFIEALLRPPAPNAALLAAAARYRDVIGADL